jgi:protein involved in plasmid replication-relaxation
MNQDSYNITDVDIRVLRALSRYHYLTAKQLSRLMYPNLHDDDRHAQRIFHRLTKHAYVLKLRALPKPKYGQDRHVHTLARNGRSYLQGLGVPVEPYFRPSEERRSTDNSPFMMHRLAAIDVMIAADALCRDVESISCPRMLSERELKRQPLRVQVTSLGSGIVRDVAVIPDAWFQLTNGVESPYSIAVELDRATEDQKAWRQKVAAYLAWVNGPYQAAFETDNVTVAVVCPDTHRVGQLIEWTRRELRAREVPEYAELFVFTSSSPITTPAERFFCGKVWFAADTGEAGPLLDFLPTASESGVVFQTA